MSYKSVFVFMPLIVSSLINLPEGQWFKMPNYKPSSMSLVPISSLDLQLDDYFNCDFYGPFSLSNINDININLTYRLYSVSSQNIIERIRLFDSSNHAVSVSSKATFYYTKGSTKEVSFLLSLEDYLTNNGLTLKFEIINSSTKAVLKTHSASFYPRSESYISGVTLKRNIYTSKSLGFYGDGLNINEAYETFDFTNFGDYLDIDYYYRLGIDKVSFDYPNSYDFTFEYAYLWFNDDQNLFPYYKHQNNGDIYIPITLYKQGNKIRFKYAKNFYINKRTLQISDVYRSGFVATRDFYLPVNGKNKFNNKQLCFELHNMGLDGLSTSIYLRYDVSQSLVGVCKDSDYCIIGGRK